MSSLDDEKLVTHVRSGGDPRGKTCRSAQPNLSLALLVELLAYVGLRIREPCMLRRRIDVLGCRLIVAGGAVTTDAVVFTGHTGEHPIPARGAASVELAAASP